MLGKYGIVAMSPELGTIDQESDGFFIGSPSVLKNVIEENAKWVKQAIIKV